MGETLSENKNIQSSLYFSQRNRPQISRTVATIYVWEHSDRGGYNLDPFGFVVCEALWGILAMYRSFRNQSELTLEAVSANWDHFKLLNIYFYESKSLWLPM